MLKSTIIDTSVRVIPSEKLVTYLKVHTKQIGQAPENIKKFLNKTPTKKILDESEIIPIKFEQTELQALTDLNQKQSKSINDKSDENVEEDKATSGVESISEEPKQVKDVPVEPEITEKITPDSRPFLINSDLRWIFNFLQERRKIDTDTPYLNELLQGSEMILPENHFVERNPELEERCKKLRKEQEQREYNKMTKNVDNVRKRDPEDTIAYQSEFIEACHGL